MVRAAAKNHPSVAIVTSPAAYGQVVDALGAGGFTLDQRKRLAAAAFVHTASYDSAAPRAGCRGTATPRSGFPTWTGGDFTQAATLRYGRTRISEPRSTAMELRVASAEQLHGKEMSYNNYVDTGRGAGCARPRRPAHGRDRQARQPLWHRRRRDDRGGYARAHATDPVSAFGGSSRPTSR